MNENILRRVKENLRAKFYLTNDSWLADCVEYYLSEHGNPNDAEVLEFVISQWQLSDLREISNEKPSLPKNLSQQICTILRGYFVLQMEEVYDIAESKYKQLEKIRNVSTDNIRATELETTQAWEPKKKRMLQFHLTDGSQNVTAIEYKPVRFLNEKLLPGYKLMIRGPVTCRRGVIMLDESNVSEIGGEVEPLLVKNAYENVLARALNLPENSDPYNDKMKTNGTADEIIFDDDFDVGNEAVDFMEKSSQQKNSTKTLNCRSSDENSTVQTSTSNRTGYHNNEPKNESKNECSISGLVNESESDLIFDMIDENEFTDVPKNSAESRNISKSDCKNSAWVLPQESKLPQDDKFKKSKINVSGSCNNQALKTIPDKFEVVDSVDLDFLDEELEFEKATKIEPQSRNNFTSLKNSAPVLSRKLEFPDDDDDDDEGFDLKIVPKLEIASKTINRTPVRVLPKETDVPDGDDDDDDLLLITEDTRLSSADICRRPSNDVETNCRIGEMTKLKIDADTKQKLTLFAEKTIVSFPKQPNQMGNKRNASVLSPPVVKPPAEKVRCTQNTPKSIKTNNRKITDYMKKDNLPESSATLSKFCDDISELFATNVVDKVIRKTVRSKFNDFQKLSRNGDTWMMNATLIDKTGKIDVVVSSEILEKILGYSVAEFRMKKKQKKNNPEVENELRQSFRSAENKIRNMDALLEVELAPHQKPKVVKIKDFTDEQRRILENAAKLHNA